MDAGRLDSPQMASMAPGDGALAESRYLSMFTYHPHAAFSVDLRGYYTAANPAALAMTGLSLQEMRETHFAEVVHPDDLHILNEAFDAALAKVSQQFEARVVRADGDVLEIRCTVIPIVIADEVVGVHGITEDVTEANELRRQLERANVAKALFLANVSHEIRTPLASIIGATELLLDAELEPEPDHFARMVHRSGERLMRLVDDILDFSRLDAHQVSLRRTPFSVRAVVEDIAEWATPLAESRGLTASFVVGESVPAESVGDGVRLSQVLTNLVHNAIKFTQRGGVEVRVEGRSAPDPYDDDGSATWVELAVTDTGIGIAEDHLDSLFEPFTQADPTATRGYEGVGLGLAICRDLVDLMGGEIRASTTVGEGSTFTVVVPLGRAG